jgi:RHS repeat-associated protein
VKLLKTLVPTRKHKTPASAGINKHLCSNHAVDKGVSISTRQMKAPLDQCSRAPAGALVRSAATDRSSSVRRIPASRSKATDPNGKITRVTDAANAITQYAYDPRNRLTSITDPFNVVEQWTWDNKGNLATYKDRRNKTTTFSYDALDRLSGTIYADATSTTFGYSYPAGGLAEMTMTEGTNTITRRFDNRDRLSYEVTPQGRIDYAYDAADRRSSMTVQGQSALTYAWDDADRLSTITQGARSIALAYDQANRRSKITFPGTLEQRMTYAKPWGRPSAISYFSGTTPVQLDALTDASFDGDGRPISRTATAAANGIPNAVNTLPTAFTASYTNNRLTTFNGAAWTYDTQGNLTGDGTNTYVWDVRNRLMQIKQGATVTASFEYDALNRRTKKIIGTASTEYLHDGLTPVQEKRVGDITQLITGPGIDDYLSRITTTIGATPTTTTRNYLTDFLGSTTALADDAGAIKTTYGYEPYGEATVSGEATVNSFQYTGRENDGTGLYYYRARYYHPKAKRFISDDPIGQAGGINTFAYAGGSPMLYRDPNGDTPVTIGIGAILGGVTGAIQARNSGSSVLAGAFTGALAGAAAGFIPISFGFYANAALNGLAAGAGNALNQALGDDCFSLGQVATQSVYGALGGALGLKLSFVGARSFLNTNRTSFSSLDTSTAIGRIAASRGEIIGAYTGSNTQSTLNLFTSTDYGGYRPNGR